MFCLKVCQSSEIEKPINCIYTKKITNNSVEYHYIKRADQWLFCILFKNSVTETPILFSISQNKNLFFSKSKIITYKMFYLKVKIINP